MFPIVLLAIVACASAAPYYNHHNHYKPHHGYDDSVLGPYFEQEIFDTSRFWQNLRREMTELNVMLDNLHKRFPATTSDAKIDGNMYKVTIYLSGFDEKDITVKARKGLLIVQAVHKEGGMKENSYLDVRTLPDSVNVDGKWIFENGVLTITFTLAQNSDGKEESATTQMPLVPTPSDVTEATAPPRGDVDLSTNLLTDDTNYDQRNPVEATTYAVDLKDEVELLPIHY